MKKLFIFTILLMGFSQYVFGEKLIEIETEGLSKKTTAVEARKEISNQKIKEISEKYIKEIIGEDKFNSKFSLIHKKIIAQSGRYIAYIRNRNPKQTPEGFLMKINMKISLKNLKALLLKYGLLYNFEGSSQILPMVSFVDSVNSTDFFWWRSPTAPSFLRDLSRNFYKIFKDAVFPKGFFSLSPSQFNLYHSIPSDLKTEGLGLVNQSGVAKSFEAALILRGQFDILPRKKKVYQIKVNLELVHMNNGRVIASTARTYSAEQGFFQQAVGRKMNEIFKKVSQSLSSQLHDSWRKGTLGTNLIKLTLKGNLNYTQLKQFQNLISSNVKSVKSMSERLFSPSEIVYDINLSGSARHLASELSQNKWPRFRVRVTRVFDNEIEIQVGAH